MRISQSILRIAFCLLVLGAIYPCSIAEEITCYWAEKFFVQSLAFSPDGKSLVGGGYKKVLLWKLDSKIPVLSLQEFTNNIHTVQYIGKANHILAAGPSSFTDSDRHYFRTTTLVTWNLETREVAGRVDVFGNRCFDISPTGEYVICSNKYGAIPKPKGARQDQYDATSASVYAVGSGRKIMVLHGHDPWIGAAKFMPDGNHIISVCGGNKLFIWELKRKKKIDEFSSKDIVRYLAFSTDGRSLFTSPGHSGDWRVSCVQHWDMASKELVRSYPIRVVEHMKSSPDSSQLAVAAGGSIWLFDTHTGKELSRWNGHQGTITSLCFSQDGKMLASGGTHGTIKIWRLPK